METKPPAGTVPHGRREHMAHPRFDERVKGLGAARGGVGPPDRLDAGANLLDRAAPVEFAEVEQQRPRGDQGGNVGCIAVGVDAGNEVGEAVEEVRPLYGRVGGQAAVADEAFQSLVQRSDEPGVRGAHRVAVTADPRGVDLGA